MAEPGLVAPDLGARAFKLDAHYSRAELEGFGHSKCNATRDRGWHLRALEAQAEELDFSRRLESGQLRSTRVLALQATGMRALALASDPADGYLRFGDVVMLQNADTGLCAAFAPSHDAAVSLSHLSATASEDIRPCVRTALRVERPATHHGGPLPDPQSRVRFGEGVALSVVAAEEWGAPFCANGQDAVEASPNAKGARLFVATHSTPFDHALALPSLDRHARTTHLGVLAGAGAKDSEVLWRFVRCKPATQAVDYWDQRALSHDGAPRTIADAADRPHSTPHGRGPLPARAVAAGAASLAQQAGRSGKLLAPVGSVEWPQQGRDPASGDGGDAAEFVSVHLAVALQHCASHLVLSVPAPAKREPAPQRLAAGWPRGLAAASAAASRLRSPLFGDEPRLCAELNPHASEPLQTGRAESAAQARRIARARSGVVPPTALWVVHTAGSIARARTQAGGAEAVRAQRHAAQADVPLHAQQPQPQGPAPYRSQRGAVRRAPPARGIIPLLYNANKC